VEANTSHTHVAAQVDGHSGVLERLTSVVASQSRGGRSRSRRSGDLATARLDHYLRDSRAVVLHYRHLPGDRRGISHLIVGPAGVTVVDSHRYKTSPIKFDGRSLRGSTRKYTNQLKAVLSQVEAVRRLLSDTPYAKVPIEAAVAQRKVSGARVLQGINSPRVIVCGTRTIAGEASRQGPLSTRRVRGLAAYLDDVLG
jgi:nuclease-like protein